MIAKVKSLCAKHREVLLYLIFGFLTTVVGWSVYYAILFGGRAIFGIPVTFFDPCLLLPIVKNQTRKKEEDTWQNVLRS